MIYAHARYPQSRALRATAVVALTVLCSGLLGCRDDPKAKLIGTWKVVSDPAASKPTGVAGIVSDTLGSSVIELKQDGSFTMTMTTLGTPKTIEGTWTLSDSSLTLTPQKTDPTLQGAIPPGQVMLLTVGSGGTRLTLEGRSGKQIQFQKAP